MPLSALTLRLRLTLWYSTVLAAIIFLFGVSIYTMLVVGLTRQLDENLETAANRIVGSANLSSLASVLDFLPQLNQFGGASIFAQLWTVDGQLSRQSDVLNRSEFEQPLDPQGLLEGRKAWRDVLVRGTHLRVFTLPVVGSSGRVIGYLQTANARNTVDTTEHALLIVLITGGVVAVASAALIGWLSARRALGPLDTITQTALQITRADDLSRRIPLTENPNDEVGRLAMAFNESLERLERLFNAQRRFLADVSHELRTPLTAIRGNVDLLRRMGGADPTSLDAIQSEAERMSRLVGDLLLLAQADAGNLPLVQTPVELDTLLLEVYRESQVLAGGVLVNIGEIDQAQVLGDRDRLKQLLLNLVSNALKFTSDGGRVTLGLARVNDWARLTVTDTGIGIPPDELPHIFERFYRVDKARSRAMGGAGLGLSIAQRIARMHGGRIEAASEGVAGRGATFCVWLPLIESTSASHSASQASPAAPESPRLGLPKLTR